MKILITGANGQMGSTLCDILVHRGENVFGLKRRSSNKVLNNLSFCLDKSNFTLLDGDISDAFFVSDLVNNKFDWIINCAAMPHVAHSFSTPVANLSVNSLGVLNFLEAIRHNSPTTKFLNMGTSEEFSGKKSLKMRRDILAGKSYLGLDFVNVQNFSIPFEPSSPYGISKLAAHLYVKLYREIYGMWAVQPICFNFESSRRSEDYVTMKIIKYVGRLYRAELKKGEKLELGNIKSSRAWSLCADTAEGLILCMEQEKPQDYIFSHYESHTVEEFLDLAFKLIGKNWQDYVVISEKYWRPVDVDYLLGDITETREKLGWCPTTSFEELVRIMLQEETGQLFNCRGYTITTNDLEDIVYRIRAYQNA